MDPNQAQNEVIYNFLEFGLYVLIEIESDYSLWQFLTSSRGWAHKKKFGGPNLGQAGQNWPQN